MIVQIKANLKKQKNQTQGFERNFAGGKEFK